MAPPDILCIGGATIDRKYRALAALASGTSNPVAASRSFGGVARNVCETLARLGVSAGLATRVGDDEGGRALKAGLAALGADVRLVETAPGSGTAEYIAALDADGSLALGLADMGVFDAFDAAWLAPLRPRLAEARYVFADCNLPAPVLAALVEAARGGPFPLALDPVSVAKAARLPRDLSGVALLVCNRGEAAALTGEPDAARAAESLRRRGAAAVAVTDGAGPIRLAEAGGSTTIPARPAAVVDVTGAGDALIAATLAALLAGRSLAEAVAAGAGVAALTVATAETVRSDLTADALAQGRRSAA